MNINVNLEMYRDIDHISSELRHQINELEQDIDSYCANFIKTQEDLQMISLFQHMLTDLHSDLEKIDNVRCLLFN
jgi:septal ring factor EnvC (AmiA/AmiB activator)